MRPPMYMRRDSESSLPIRRDSREDEDEMERAGLRSTRLCVLITLLAILAFLSLALLASNLMLMRTLEMSHHGMRLLKFYSVRNAKTGLDEKVVHFGGREIDLNRVVTASGRVGGTIDSDLNVYGSRVLINGVENGTRLVLQENGCRLDRLNDFQIVSSANSRPIFSARHPLLPLDKRIKSIASSTIITNKIRSAVNERLRVSVDDISVRGNEAIQLKGRGIHLASGTAIHFNTTKDGSLHFSGSVFIGGAHSGVPLSTSPALSASIEALRLCICSGQRRKLFTVPGNKPCLAPAEVCK